MDDTNFATLAMLSSTYFYATFGMLKTLDGNAKMCKNYKNAHKNVCDQLKCTHARKLRWKHIYQNIYDVWKKIHSGFPDLYILISSSALVSSGSGQRALCDQYGELRKRRVDRFTGQCSCATVPRFLIREPHGGRRGTSRAQDACRYC